MDHDAPAQGLRARQRQRRSVAILQAAKIVFREKGFDGARIEDVAERAEVAVGTVYNYFDTKSGLLLALVAMHAGEASRARLEIVENPPDDLRAALLAHLDAVMDPSLKYLDKGLWRHVQTAGILDAGGTVGSLAGVIEENLLAERTRIIETLQRRGTVPAALPAREVAEIINAIGFFIWVIFLSDEKLSLKRMKSRVAARWELLLSRLLDTAPSNGGRPARATSGS